MLGDLGVVPLAAHLFIFYFGMMSMVTPPVALAGYASASIAEAPIMQTSFAAFRFALVGFTLPYMFVFRPELLMLAADGGTASAPAIAGAVALAAAGILPLAAAISAGCRGRSGCNCRSMIAITFAGSPMSAGISSGGTAIFGSAGAVPRAG